MIQTDASDGAHGYFAAAARDVFVMVSHRPPSARTLDHLDRDLGTFTAARRGQGFFVHYSFLGSEFVLPTEETRVAVQRVAGRWVNQLSGSAFVVAIDGFSGAAIRGLFSGIALALRPKSPVRIFAHEDEAITWFGGLAPKAALPEHARFRELVAELSRLSLAAETKVA